jgi:hypothetical protein
MRLGISVVMMTNDYARCRQVRRRNSPDDVRGLFRVRVTFSPGGFDPGRTNVVVIVLVESASQNITPR